MASDSETEEIALLFEETSDLAREIERDESDLNELLERISIAISSFESLKEDFPMLGKI